MRRPIIPCLVPLNNQLLKYGYDLCLVHKYENIKICDSVGSTKQERDTSYSQIVQALELVKQHDPRRFRRILRQFDYIVNCRLVAFAEYSRDLRCCQVDLARVDVAKNKRGGLVILGGFLVHEATHGVISSRGITYFDDVEKGLRVERLCHREEWCFLHQVVPNLKTPVFSEDAYRERWAAKPHQNVASLIKRFRQHEPPSV